MGRDRRAFQYTAIALLADGQPIAETFASDVEYLAGDELPLSSARCTSKALRMGRRDPSMVTRSLSASCAAASCSRWPLAPSGAEEQARHRCLGTS
jgi:hypothetical protein